MVEMTKAEAVERYGERMPDEVEYWAMLSDGMLGWRPSVPLGYLTNDDTRIRFPDPDHGVGEWREKVDIKRRVDSMVEAGRDSSSIRAHKELLGVTASGHGIGFPCVVDCDGKNPEEAFRAFMAGHAVRTTALFDPNPNVAFTASSADKPEPFVFGNRHIDENTDSDHLLNSLPEGRLYSMRSKQPEATRPLVTMEAWQAAALFGEAMVGVECSNGATVVGMGQLGGLFVDRETEGGLVARYELHSGELTFSLPRVRYVPTEEQPDEPSVGEVWVDEAGSAASLFTHEKGVFEIWVEGSPEFAAVGPSASAGWCGSLRECNVHTRVRPVPADAVGVSGERSVISGSSKQDIVQEGRLFSIHEPGKFRHKESPYNPTKEAAVNGHIVRAETVEHAAHYKYHCSCGAWTEAYSPREGEWLSHGINGWSLGPNDAAVSTEPPGIVADLPEPTFDCPSCRDTGRRTYHDGKERDCGACGDGPCVECDEAGVVAFACEHGGTREGVVGVWVTEDNDPSGVKKDCLRLSGLKHTGIPCLFTTRSKLSVPLDNQEALAELLCPDA